MPLLGDLDQAELAQVSGFLTVAALHPGETLYAEGTPATSACFLVSGALDAFARLPGGGEAMVGTIAPGDIIGEMALLNGGQRTASVRARTAAQVIEVSSAFFQAAIGQMDLPAHKILRRVIVVLATRLSDVRDRIIAATTDRILAPEPLAAAGPSEVAATGRFEIRPFLPLLPGLRGFAPDEIDRLLGFGRIVEHPARSGLYHEGAAAEAAWLVLRGAVECVALRGGRRPLAVIGPGRLCGANEILTEQDRRSGAATRSGALLLEIGRDPFAALFHGAAPECLKFQHALGRDQLNELRSANNLLALLVNQAQIRTGPRRPALAGQALR